MADAQIVIHLGEMKKGLEQQARQALEVIGTKAADYARMRAPVKTSTLKNSMTHKCTSNTTVVVGTPVEYAPYVELGHAQRPGRYVPAIGKRLKKSWVDGKPYLRPAFEDHVEEYKRILIYFLSQ